LNSSDRKAARLDSAVAALSEASSNVPYLRASRRACATPVRPRTTSGLCLYAGNENSNPYYGPMAGISDEQFRKILENNVLANHWLIQMAAPGMLELSDGSIVIISSIGA
jgi:NAD(P)-dependent dehydrogenase (short-subunit alcohol dehydrogenase family)